MMRFAAAATGGLIMLTGVFAMAGPVPDDTPGSPGEWGFRPEAGTVSEVNPPGFSWRPQEGAASYEIRVARDADFRNIVYGAEDIEWSVHCPAVTLPPGAYRWQMRFTTAAGEPSEWCQSREFSIPEGVPELPLPGRRALLDRIPTSHPRLFIRPEDVPGLRERAAGDLKPLYDRLVESCEKILADPPPTAEPEKYPPGMERGSDPWRTIWWGNRTYTQKALDSAATLAFTRLLGGREEYGLKAREILLACAAWDPKGATGYRYNDEAGMPYNYYFSRTYTFVNDLLSDADKALCREVMAIRGKEMYDHLCPRHLWRPYASHSNRAWHFLGEIGIAFAGEIPEAEQWAWFAANVFANVYPVWCDADGGWHEGMAYWSSYISRFTWWADIMRSAMGVSAYDKPYFSRIGYYPMYLQPPGTVGGGFGDLTASRKSADSRGLMSVLAAQAGNPYWQWYVDIHGGSVPSGGYVGFVRGSLPPVEAREPVDLPSSRVFRGTGQAVLNSNLLSADDNVEIIFKSSPFGTQSHGYESQNAFLLYAFGERLLIRTGRRDSYGSEHHKKWMWETKSVNSITVNGEGQQGHSAAATGEIRDFMTTDGFDWVVGEAAPAYMGKLKRFTRRILFVKPEAVLIYDTVEAPEAAEFEWLLHSPVPMERNGQTDIRIENGKAACRVEFLLPGDLSLEYTDAFETPPRPRIKLVEYHLTARAREKVAVREFITVLRPHKTGAALQGDSRVSANEGGYAVSIPLADGGRAVVLLNPSPGRIVSAEGLQTSAEVAAARFGSDGTEKTRFASSLP